jgi:hypothetical protein
MPSPRLEMRDGRVYAIGWRGGRETVYCLDAADGRVFCKDKRGSIPCLAVATSPKNRDRGAD